jgi:heme/copper-type cytochrome/quinol oxidase subunit 2
LLAAAAAHVGGVVILAVDTRDVYDRTASVYAPIALAVFVLVVAATLVLTWRGTRRERPSGPTEAHRIEAGVAVVIAVIVAVLVPVTLHEQGRVDAAKASAVAPGDLRVRVIGAKWNWRFAYPGRGIEVAGRAGAPATLTVPAGRPVHFAATSLDVVHAFWIPAMRFQRELFPGRDVRFTLTFPHPGLNTNAACSFFCGLGHSDMRFEVRVLPAAAFDAWASRAGSGSAP